MQNRLATTCLPVWFITMHFIKEEISQFSFLWALLDRCSMVCVNSLAKYSLNTLEQRQDWIQLECSWNPRVPCHEKSHCKSSKIKCLAELTCLIRPKMGIVSCPTLSITKLLNQQEAGCIHLGSKRSFLMRRRSVFHHIYPPNSKKVWCCIWWKVERPTFVLVPLFCLPKRKHCKQPVS